MDNNNHYMLLNSSCCPLCGCEELSPPLEVIASDVTDIDNKFTIIECSECRLAWQWPLIRRAEESIEFFDNAYSGSDDDSSSYFHYDRKSQITNLELEYINSVAPSKGKLLDIGCGNGTFVSNANKDGWDATGIDPAAPVGCDPAVIRGDLSSLGKNKYDVITMWDVIEHLEKPADLLTSIKDLLAQDGVLVVETGNYMSTDRIFFKDSWWCFQFDHRWYFSPHNLEQLIEKLGFSIISLSKRALRPGWEGTAHYKGPSLLRTFAKLLLKPFSASSTLKQYNQLKNISKNYKETSGLHIFACAFKINTQG